MSISGVQRMMGIYGLSWPNDVSTSVYAGNILHVLPRTASIPNTSATNQNLKIYSVNISFQDTSVVSQRYAHVCQCVCVCVREREKKKKHN